MQTDVTERVRVEGEREAAFAAEQAARREAELARAIAEQARSDAERAQADAERAQSRLALMAEATSTLIATLDMAELLDRLAGLCVPLLADWVFITLVDAHGEVARDRRPAPATAATEELRRVRRRCTSATCPRLARAGAACAPPGRCSSTGARRRRSWPRSSPTPAPREAFEPARRRPRC